MATVWRSQCAFARLFVRKTGQNLNNALDLGIKATLEPLWVSSLTRNYSNYAHSPFVTRIKEQYKFDVVKKPPEWTYVERLLPFETIPQITPKDNYPSGWVPPKEEAKNLPYFISRTKNHEIPIYLTLSHRGHSKKTIVKKIEGDIWQMNDEIRYHLKKIHNRYIETRVHELARFIQVKGDYVNDLRNWAISKGF